MANIFKQRKLVLELIDLEKESCAEQKASLDAGEISPGLDELHLMGNGENGQFENELLKRILKKKNVGNKDVWHVIEFKRVLDLCIKNGFIEQWPNDDFTKQDRYHGELGKVARTSQRMIQVAANKGLEITDWRYFWFKYVTKELPEPSRLVFGVISSVITAALTSLAFWKLFV